MYARDFNLVRSYEGNLVQCWNSARDSVDIAPCPLGEGHAPIYTYSYQVQTYVVRSKESVSRHFHQKSLLMYVCMERTVTLAHCVGIYVNLEKRQVYH